MRTPKSCAITAKLPQVRVMCHRMTLMCVSSVMNRTTERFNNMTLTKAENALFDIEIRIKKMLDNGDLTATEMLDELLLIKDVIIAEAIDR